MQYSVDDIKTFTDLLNQVANEYGDEHTLCKHLKQMIDLYYFLLEKKVLHTNGLSEMQILPILYLEGDKPYYLQEPLFLHKDPQGLVGFLIHHLDTGLKQLPSTKHQLLYRNSNYLYKNIAKGNVIEVPGYMTTSKEDFDNAPYKYIIRTSENSRAHDIYEVYNHGYQYPYPEWQVEFERNSKFLVKEIVEQGNVKIVYLEEL